MKQLNQASHVLTAKNVKSLNVCIAINVKSKGAANLTLGTHATRHPNVKATRIYSYKREVSFTFAIQ